MLIVNSSIILRILRVSSCIWVGLAIVLQSSSAVAAPKASSNEENLAQALLLYKEGKYLETMNRLHRISGNSKLEATVRYWKGLVRTKQQKYDLAIINFETAKRLGADAADLNYNLGQAYFAAQKLNEAMIAFRASAEDSRYKISASYYYMGYISQLREEYDQALSYYKKISRLQTDEDSVRQPALFQTAEIHFDKVKKVTDTEKRVTTLLEKIRPLYETVVNLKPDSIAGKEAQTRIDLIDTESRKFQAEIQSKKSWKFKVENDIRYDSNVITKADQAVLSVANQASMINKTTARASFEKALSDKWKIDASLKSSLKLHSQRSSPDIFKNDAAVLGASVSFDRKNDFFAKDSKHTIGYDLTYTLQDHKKQHKFSYFSTTHSLFFEETLKLWDVGTTSFKGTWKYYSHHLPTSENYQLVATVQQKFALSKTLRLSSTLQTTWLLGAQPTSDTIRYELNNRLPIPFADTDLTLIPYLGLSFLDTKNQSPTRGFERKMNLNLTLRKNIRRENRYILKVGYDYTRNLSRDKANQQYSRHEVFFSGAYRF